MKPEEEQLIDDLLADESRRETTLLAGAKILRRRRHERTARRILVLVVLMSAIAVVLEQRNRQAMPVQVSVKETKPAAVPQVKYLTDAELLALFPNTPVGLAKLSDGKTILIFPRPGDAARFITRL